MASISKDPQGNRTVQFVGNDGKRRSIRLGKVNQKTADEVRTKVQHLNALKGAGVAPDLDTIQWLAKIGDDLAAKLAAVGLCQTRQTSTLGEFLNDFLERRKDSKPASRIAWGQSAQNLKDHFGTDRPLSGIEAGDADDFKRKLLDGRYSGTTVSKRLGHANTFFNEARRRKLITENPFEDVKHQSAPAKERQVYVPAETIRKAMDAADPKFRLLLALSRFAGLRVPSEPMLLKWSDMSWDAGRMTVTSPKTEHHVGKESRIVPMFPELRAVLEEAFELATPGDDFLFPQSYRDAAEGENGWRNVNLRTQFLRILRRAGIQSWPKLFHNLRASCETDLVKRHPIHVVTAWLGNTPAIAQRHYLMVMESDFDTAREGGAESGAVLVQNPVQQASASKGTQWKEIAKGPEKDGKMHDAATPCNSQQNEGWRRRESNGIPEVGTCNDLGRSSDARAANSGAVLPDPAVIADLAYLIRERLGDEYGVILPDALDALWEALEAPAGIRPGLATVEA
jgi:integrase